MEIGTEVVLESEALRVTVLPTLGGKIASLRWRRGDVELLQAPLRPYEERTLTMGFEEGDASGFDECLPSVAACAVPGPDGTVQIPDHGDFWRLPWSCTRNGMSLAMAATGVSLPLRLERTLALEGAALRLSYRVKNIGEGPAEYGWSAHPLFAVERGDRVELPASVKEVRVEGSAGGRLGRKGAMHPWPRTRSATGASIDWSVAGGPGDEVGDKVFAAAPPEGWAAVVRREQRVRVEVRFNAAQTPWLGLWLCYGGWPERQSARQQCVALEPCTAPVDSLAEARQQGWARKLAPGASDAWSMEIRVAAQERL